MAPHVARQSLVNELMEHTTCDTQIVAQLLASLLMSNLDDASRILRGFTDEEIRHVFEKTASTVQTSACVSVLRRAMVAPASRAFEASKAKRAPAAMEAEDGAPRCVRQRLLRPR